MSTEFVGVGTFSMRHQLGDRWALRVVRVATVGGRETPIDVTGIAYRCQWRVNALDVAAAASATIDTSDAVNGIIVASITGAAVRALGVGTWRYQFEDVTNETTLFGGLVTLEEDVAR